MNAPRPISITRQPIELSKLLKFSGLVASGGDAKLVITGGLVKVNGVVETRKGKKLVTGDRITLADETVIIEGE